MPIGFHIHKAPARPKPEFLEQFRDVVTAHLSDNMSRMCGTVGLRRYNPRGKLVGTALTVRTRHGDNLMIHKALNHAEPGDVLVVDGGGDISQALVGELMMLYARSRGIVGFVIDGAIRDVAAFADSDFPCYARGETHKGPYKDGPGEIHVPVTIGGLVIHPGDIVVGDEDGVVALSPAIAPEVLAAARKQFEREEKAKADIAAGRYDRSWVDKALAAKGVLGS
ncbi:MAG: RraA family protein [Hyphomicrobiales bacterium]|nr:RraA family protein [Hyphomicrobiales bacterium]